MDWNTKIKGKIPLHFKIFAIGIALAIGYGSLMLQSQLIADRILFQPPLILPTTSQGFYIETANGRRIHAVYLPNPQSPYVLLYSHGNAVDLERLGPLLKAFHAHGYAIFAYDYQGYGSSQGTPSEENTYLDIETAYRYLTKNLNIPPSRIIAMGSSLGAAVTMELAIKKPLAGVILQSPFLSAYRVYTIIPLLPWDQYNNAAKAKKLTAPVLVIHGKKDHTIPFWHGQELYQRIKAPKMALWLEEADHHTILSRHSKAYWKTLEDFIQRLQRKGLAPQ